MKSRFKQLLASIMALTMLLSLLPISAVAANTGNTLPVEQVSTISDDYQGVVVKYNAPGTDGLADNVVRLDLGYHKVPAFNVSGIALKYDEAAVKLGKYNGSTVTAVPIDALSKKVTAANTLAALAPKTYTADILVGGSGSDYADALVGQQSFFTHTNSSAQADYAIIENPDTAFVTVGVENKEFTGKFMVYFSVNLEMEKDTFESVFSCLDYTATDDGKSYFNTSSINETVYVASVYFLVNDGAELTADTFRTYDINGTSTGAYMAGPNSFKSEKIVFLGFPAPAAPTAQVTLVGYASRSDAEGKTNPASGLTVVLKKGTETIGTYTTGNEGVLTTDGTNATGPLSLEAGTYTCEVSGGTGSPNSVTFTVSEEEAAGSTAKTVEVYTLGSSEASEQAFNIGITDKDMLGKALADNTPVKVTFGGKTVDAQVSNGVISVMTLPSSNPQDVKIEAEGYQEETVSVTFSNARAATVADVSLAQVRTKIELSVPVADGETAYVIIDKQPDGTVTDSMAMELPKTVPVTGAGGAGGTAVLELPDGDYTYTIQTPGKEDVTMDLDVDNTGLQNGGTTTGKVTISDPDDSTKKTEITVPDSGSTANTATADQGTTVTGSSGATAALPAITDRLYSVVGTWTNTGMHVNVYLMNTKAITGTFGMTFDRVLFDAGTTLSVNLTGIEAIKPSAGSDLMVGGTALVNPLQTANGEYLLAWRAKDNVPVDATAGKVKIIDFDLTFASGIDNTNFQSKVTDTTLKSLAFAPSAWMNPINNYFSNANEKAEFVSKYWRATDNENVTLTDPNRLATAKALEGGFYQTYSSTGDVAIPQDTRQQFTFETFGGAEKLKFQVNEPGGQPVPGATVTVTDTAGNPIGSGTTGPDGTVEIPVPGDKDVKYIVTKPGYKDSAETTVPVANQGDTQTVQLVPEQSHPVKIYDAANAHVVLTGGDAYNLTDYQFTLTPEAGYQWTGGTMPTGSDLTIKMVTSGTDSDFDSDTGCTALTATWDNTLNKYTIAGATLTAGSGTIIIKVAASKVEQSTTRYTVTVNSGAHGTFGYTDAAADSTITPNTSATGLTGTLTEQLAAGKTISAKYSFAGDGPIDAANATKKTNGEQYQAWVIESLVVNGTSVPLTDYQKIHGVNDYQLTGISQNQVINVIYGEATVDGDVIVTPPVPDPTDNANITVIISDFGKANVNSAGDWDGPDTKSYTVAAGDEFNAVFTGDTGYVIDTVTLDGVSMLSDSKWTNGTASAAETTAYTSGTLAFTAVGGTNYTVVVTFRAENGPSLFAQLEVVNRSGNGGTVPTGTSIQPIGLPATVAINPVTGNKIDVIDLTEPGGTLTDVTPDPDVDTSFVPTTSYTYSTPNLKAGTTVVGVSFKKDATEYFVMLGVEYAVVSATGSPTAATITFTDTGDGSQIVYGPDQLGAYKLQAPATAGVKKVEEYKLSIPAGTYNVTVTKKGYLNYTVTDFKITDGVPPTAGSSDSAVMTLVETNVGADNETIIYFGAKSGESANTSKAIAITLGDATWDGKLIALDDIAQVANGLQSGGATAGQKKRADLDESGTPAAEDMSYVIQNYAQRSTNVTYKTFMGVTT